MADAKGRPIRMVLSAGHRSDHVGALAMLSPLPQAAVLLADRGYDANWFGEALADLGVPCIPSRRTRKVAIPHDPVAYASVTASRTPLPASRTGDALPPATIAAPTSSSTSSPLPTCSDYES